MHGGAGEIPRPFSFAGAAPIPLAALRAGTQSSRRLDPAAEVRYP